MNRTSLYIVRKVIVPIAGRINSLRNNSGRIKMILLCIFLAGSVNSFSQLFENFITVSGNKLMDGKNEFRFLSYNIPNLNFVEDEMAFSVVSPFRLPTEYEIVDALMSIKQMGGRVVRIYTLPVKRKEQSDKVPATVLGPGQFNEEAFKINDLMLATANKLGIRIIFPFVNAWKWMGGRPQYAEFRNKKLEDFWTDPQIIADVEKTIEYTINRTNTITGIKYKDDKAILCWETGNELPSPTEWTITIARYIKAQDNNHLVMDGYSRPTIKKDLLNEPSVDIITTHHYEIGQKQTGENIRKNLEVIHGKKAYIIGEFGFQSTTALEKTIDQIITDKNIAGALIWSLRSHREEGGFYWHAEPFGHGVYKAYHWPGFASGNAYDEKNFMELFRHKAFAIQGLPDQPIEKPAAPKLLEIRKVYNINWQGSAGASSYNIERAEMPDGPWRAIAVNVSDADVQYTALFHDKTAELGKSYYYRVAAVNIGGTSETSNVVGPVKVTEQALIDDMSNFSKLYTSAAVTLESGNDRKFKEDIYRIGGKKNSEITYLVPGKLKGIKVYSFENSPDTVLVVKTSVDDVSYENAKTGVSCFYEAKNDYGSWYPVLYETLESTGTTKFVKIVFKNEAQISRVEIIYE
jgi:hypothetical protein